MEYRNIMCAIDFGEGMDRLVQRAHDVAERYSARLHLMHVVEPVVPTPPYEMPGVMPLELEEQLSKHARSELTKLAESYRIDETDILVEVGSTRAMIIETAEGRNIDLIVVGSHGRHGVGLLLGSTANAVLHHAACDVLAVRIGAVSS
jgi:universal stress protein A